MPLSIGYLPRALRLTDHTGLSVQSFLSFLKSVPMPRSASGQSESSGLLFARHKHVASYSSSPRWNSAQRSL